MTGVFIRSMPKVLASLASVIEAKTEPNRQGSRLCWSRGTPAPSATDSGKERYALLGGSGGSFGDLQLAALVVSAPQSISSAGLKALSFPEYSELEAF